MQSYHDGDIWRHAYFLLLVDDYNRFMWLIVLKTKDEAATAIRRFKIEAELESRYPLRVLRTD
jgi:hypothetical protein